MRIEPHLPLDTAALVACSVPTGWGSAVYSGRVRPGDVVVVVGLGGVGCERGAGRGERRRAARHRRRPGRDEAASSPSRWAPPTPWPAPSEAAALARELSRGTGADVVVVTVGTMSAEVMTGACRAWARAARWCSRRWPTACRTARRRCAGSWRPCSSSGSRARCSGSCNPFRDIPMLLRLHEEGRLELDRLITRRYSLDQLNEGYRDQAAGTDRPRPARAPALRADSGHFCRSGDEAAGWLGSARAWLNRRIAVLDVDGTLVDSNYQHALAWYRALRSLGETFPIWRMHRLIGMGGDQLRHGLGGEELEAPDRRRGARAAGQGGRRAARRDRAAARRPRPARGDQGARPPAGAGQLRSAAARRLRPRPARRPRHRRRRGPPATTPRRPSRRRTCCRWR